MPCQSYESNWANDYSDEKIKKLKAECDKLARIACAAMTELEKQGREDFLVLKNEEVGHWWAAHKEADRKERERIAEIERKEQVKKDALARLTDEEKELLGLKKSVKHQNTQEYSWYDEEVYEELDLSEKIEDLKRYCLQDLKHIHKYWR